jgi:hypothetical protein
LCRWRKLVIGTAETSRAAYRNHNNDNWNNNGFRVGWAAHFFPNGSAGIAARLRLGGRGREPAKVRERKRSLFLAASGANRPGK